MSTIENARPPLTEHDKLHAVHERSQACGEFIEWLQHEKNIHLGRSHSHSRISTLPSY